jgi:hypothetical protein
MIETLNKIELRTAVEVKVRKLLTEDLAVVKGNVRFLQGDVDRMVVGTSEFE